MAFIFNGEQDLLSYGNQIGGTIDVGGVDWEGDIKQTSTITFLLFCAFSALFSYLLFCIAFFNLFALSTFLHFF